MKFPNISKNDLVSCFQNIGVSNSDLIYVASYMPIFGHDPGILPKTVSALQKCVGSKGTIVMPTFNWSYCSSGKMDLNETPSQVGVLTEFFRTQEGVTRSETPPWCTFASWGALSNEISAIRGTSPFGPDGITQYLHDKNAKFTLIGCPYEDAVIHTHWLEEELQVPYRHWKRFLGTVTNGEKTTEDVSYMYARNLDIKATIDTRAITTEFEKSGKVTVEKVGLGKIRCFPIMEYTKFLRPYIVNDPLFLLDTISRERYLRKIGDE